MLVLLACATATSDTSDTKVTPGVVSLGGLTALSPDEAVADVTMDDAGTLTCGDATADVPAGGGLVYIAGMTPGSSVDCTLSDGVTTAGGSVTLPATASPGIVVFDDTHDEEAGNADWVIDDDAPSPSPSSPSSAESWTGAYSSFGYDLLGIGYTVRTATSPLGSSTLGDAQVLVLPEPNSPLSAGELAELTTFVEGGGGLVLITNHHESDRDDDGVEPTQVGQDVLDALGAGVDQAIQDYDFGDEANVTPRSGPAGDPILHGRNGDVGEVDFYQGSSFTLSGLPADRAVVWIPGELDEPTVRVAAAYVGAGRVVCIPDSAAADDGTGQPGNDAMYDAWTEADNRAFFLNAVDWAAGVR